MMNSAAGKIKFGLNIDNVMRLEMSMKRLTTEFWIQLGVITEIIELMIEIFRLRVNILISSQT